MLTFRRFLLAACVPCLASGFQPAAARIGRLQGMTKSHLNLQSTPDADEGSSSSTSTSVDRRSALGGIISAAAAASALLAVVGPVQPSLAAQSGAYDTSRREPDYIQKYEDFTLTDEGWSYKDVKPGSGDVSIGDGDRVVFDWSGYTIGYFGRPFEAKGGPQGGAFDKDLDYQRTVVGSGTVVKGLECALRSMKPGGIRQVVVPYGPLSYPPDDLEHVKVGPKPTTFSGQRALNFVLENPRVDRTLLFNVKVIRVDKKDPKTGGFKRG